MRLPGGESDCAGGAGRLTDPRRHAGQGLLVPAGQVWLTDVIGFGVLQKPVRVEDFGVRDGGCGRGSRPCRSAANEVYQEWWLRGMSAISRLDGRSGLHSSVALPVVVGW